MAPVICIVGKHNAGKTTLLERLIPCLRERGRQIAVIKHAAHGAAFDREGSDSWRLARTEARVVMLTVPDHTVTVTPVPQDVTLAQLVALLPALDFDLVLVEGYKRSGYPKIEVHRSALGPELLVNEENLIAVVSDSEQAFTVPKFSDQDPAGLAAFLDEHIAPLNTKRDVLRLTIDGEEIPVNTFASAVISGGILGMLSALKGVQNPRHVRVELRAGQEEESK